MKTTKQKVIDDLKRVPTGNLPLDNSIIAEALIYMLENNTFIFR
jgi:hypothetical protein